jgi:hypothetical protein
MSAMPLSRARRLSASDHWRPTLCVVIDTEEEFDWSTSFDPSATTTRNIASQPLAQDIFDRHGVVPTYVIDYPVARSEEARRVLGGFHRDGRCEIGAHLHPWVTPPQVEEVNDRHSFPGNLPGDLERAKLAELASCIKAGFGDNPLIYKAGRYGVGPNTGRILADLGFRFDVSVVPHTDFSSKQGPDFSSYPDQPFVTAEGIVAIPLTVSFVGSLAPWGPTLFPRISGDRARSLRLPGLLSRAGLLERLRLSPEGHGLVDLKRQTRAALARGQRLFMLTYHSSSLLPGATSYVADDNQLQAFLAAIDGYVSFFLGECGGCTQAVSHVGDALLSSR